MTNKEANKIIKEYKPYKGFSDLSKQPKELNKLDYAKILKVQNSLIEQNEIREYLQKFHRVEWERLKETSAKLQEIIFRYWGDSILD